MTGKIVEGDIKVQTERVLKNISAVLAAAGSSMDRVVKVTVFLKNMSDYSAMNEVYGRFFKNEPPARATVGVASLPKDALLTRCHSRVAVYKFLVPVIVPKARSNALIGLLAHVVSAHGAYRE